MSNSSNNGPQSPLPRDIANEEDINLDAKFDKVTQGGMAGLFGGGAYAMVGATVSYFLCYSFMPPGLTLGLTIAGAVIGFGYGAQ